MCSLVNRWLATVPWLMLSVGVMAQNAQYRDPSKHKVQFISAKEGVQLEVLDWGGL